MCRATSALEEHVGVRMSEMGMGPSMGYLMHFLDLGAGFWTHSYMGSINEAPREVTYSEWRRMCTPQVAQSLVVCTGTMQGFSRFVSVAIY